MALDRKLVVCSFCPNMCRFTCPASRFLARQTASPAGKAWSTYLLEQGQVDWNPANVEPLYLCAGCRRCLEDCASEVAISDFLEIERQKAWALGLCPQEGMAFGQRIKRQGNPYRQASEIAATQERMRELVSREAKILFYAGCATWALHPEFAVSALRLANAAEVAVALWEGEVCCGHPLYQLGDTQGFEQQAIKVASFINSGGYEAVVTGCPSCAYNLKSLYPRALGISINAQILNLVEFLAQLVRGGRLDPGSITATSPQKTDTPVTYHDPCYLGRYQGIFAEPRQLLATWGYEVREPAHRQGLPNGLGSDDGTFSYRRAPCCGGNTTTDVLLPHLANQMGQDALSTYLATGAELLVTSCPHCYDMLATANEGGGQGIKVVDLVQLLGP